MGQPKEECTGSHVLNPRFMFWSENVPNPGRDAAIARWREEAKFFCEQFCKDFNKQ